MFGLVFGVRRSGARHWRTREYDDPGRTIDMLDGSTARLGAFLGAEVAQERRTRLKRCFNRVRLQVTAAPPSTAAIRIHLTLRQRQWQELERRRRCDLRPEATRVLPPKPLHEQLVAPLVRDLRQQLGLCVER